MNPLRALIGNMLKREPVSLGLVVAALAEACAHAFPPKEEPTMGPAGKAREPNPADSGRVRGRFGGPVLPIEDAEVIP